MTWTPRRRASSMCWTRISRLLPSVLAVDIGLDHAAPQGAGTIERIAGDQIVDRVRAHTFEEIANAVGFQLEHALGVAALEKSKGGWIIERNLLQINLHAAGLFDEPDGMIVKSQRAEPQEVHLEETDFLQIAHDPLSGDGGLVLLAAGLVGLGDDALQGDVLGERTIGDDD